MVLCKLQNGAKIATLVLYIEIWVRSGMAFHPVVGDDARVSLARQLLPQHVRTMVWIQSGFA